MTSDEIIRFDILRSILDAGQKLTDMEKGEYTALLPLVPGDLGDAARSDVAMRGVSAIATSLGIQNVSPAELSLIAEAVVGLIRVFCKDAEKRATAAGIEAAKKINTADDAERAARERR